MNTDKTAAITASIAHGPKPNLITVNFSLLNAFGSRSKPARIKIITKATFLKKKLCIISKAFLNNIFRHWKINCN